MFEEQFNGLINERRSDRAIPKKITKILRPIKQTERITPIEYKTLKEFSECGIPPFLQNSYLNGEPPPRITSLREWQKELFQRKEWKEKQSSIILVPTSGGKTLAADVAIAQHLEEDEDSKIIYALPFVSLASEKTSEFRARFSKYHVRPFYQNVGGQDFRRGSIAVCTFEKVHSLLNMAIKDNYINKFKLLVIDEIHMIGENQRGAIIEAIIVKTLLMKPRINIRIIGLTATLNYDDAIKMSKWIGGFSYFCKSRPTKLKHFFKGTDGTLFLNDKGKSKRLMNIHSIKKDVKQILNPIRSSLKQHPSSTVIVFVNTRRKTVTVAKFIADFLYADDPNLPKIDKPDQRIVNSRYFLLQRLERTETGLDTSLEYCVKHGVAFHHAGMLLEERKLVEDAARDSIISVIVATTTLSAGINIRSVSRVIIYDMYRTLSRNNKTESSSKPLNRVLIPTSVYTQMAGRAGRTDSLCGGDVFVLGQYGDEKEKTDALKLSSQIIEDLQPQMFVDGFSDRFFLQCLSVGLISSYDGAPRFVSNCFEAFIKMLSIFKNNEEELHSFLDNIWFYDSDQEFEKDSTILKEYEECKEYINKYAKEILIRLRKVKLIRENIVEPTLLGKAIANSTLSIEEGLDLKDSIDKLQLNLCLKDEVHLLYLCVPPSATSLESTPSYDKDIWQKIYGEHQDVFKMITNLDSSGFERHIILTMQNGGKKMNKELMIKIDQILDRFFYACLLQKLIAEQTVNDIVKYYDIPRGSVQSLQMQAATFAGQSVRFCEMTGCSTLGKALNTYKERLNFGVKNELLPLMKLQSCSRYIARVLVSSRISTPLELSELSEEDISRILAEKRGSGQPNEKEINLASKLKEEAKQMTKALLIIDDIENNAFSSFFNHS